MKLEMEGFGVVFFNFVAFVLVIGALFVIVHSLTRPLDRWRVRGADVARAFDPLVVAHDLLVLSDEIYEKLVYGPGLVSLAGERRAFGAALRDLRALGPRAGRARVAIAAAAGIWMARADSVRRDLR